MAVDAKTVQVGGQMRYTDDELNIMKAVFGGNEKLIKLMRKVFLPTLDFNAPLGQMIDLYMTLPVTAETNPDDVKVAVMSRNQLIAHIEGRIMELTALSQPVKTNDSPKDSNK